MPLSPIANNVTSFGFPIPTVVSFALGARASDHLTISLLVCLVSLGEQ